MKIFLTGASGFMGTQLIAFLSKVKGDSVVALSRSAQADDKIQRAAEALPTLGWPPQGPRPAPGKVEIVRGDLSTKEALIKGMSGCDAVIHAAAKVEMWGEYAPFSAVAEDTRTVVEAAKAAGVRKLVHVSTDAVLVKGRGPIGQVDETAPVGDPPAWAPYSRSKAAAEEIVLEANDPPKFESISVRPRFVWGRGDTALKPMLAAAMNAGTYKWITPPARSSTCHIVNVCHALRLAAEAAGKGGQIYFVTDGPPVVLNDFLAEYICSDPSVKRPTGSVPFWFLWRLEATLESLPFLGYGVRRQPLAGRQALALIGRDVIVDDAKIRRELGYRPLVTREDGLRDAR